MDELRRFTRYGEKRVGLHNKFYEVEAIERGGGMVNIIYARPFEGRRLRERRVDEESLARSVGERALAADDWVVDVDHGGGVANAYGYPAETECVLAVSDPFGIVVVWTNRVRANKVTYRGAAEACVSGAGDVFDLRVKSPERKQDALKTMIDRHRQEVPAMVVIALAT